MNVAQLIKSLQETPNPSATEVRVGNAASEQIVAAGDFTGGAAEDLFTAASHGIDDGDRLQLTYESAAGVVNGDVGDVFIANVLSSSTFQLTSDGSTVVENTADGTAIFRNLDDLSVSTSGQTSGGIDEDDAGYVTIG